MGGIERFGLPKQGFLDHMGTPVMPVHDTPEERTVSEGQILRNGQWSAASRNSPGRRWTTS